MRRDMSFGERLAFALAIEGLTQSEFAKNCGLSQSAISQFLTNRRLPDYNSLQAIVKASCMPIPFWFREYADLLKEIK